MHVAIPSQRHTSSPNGARRGLFLPGLRILKDAKLINLLFDFFPDPAYI
jgi:hypothetical protein